MNYKRAGLCYPHAGRTVRGYRNHQVLLGNDTTIEEKLAILANIARESRRSNKIFLSYEECTGNKKTFSNLPALVELINEAFGAGCVKVVLCIRNHFELAESSYAQFLKGGLYGINHKNFFKNDGAAIGEYFEFVHRKRGFYPFSYRDIFLKIKEQLPETSIRVLSTERSDLGGQDITEYLDQVLDVQPKDGFADLLRRWSGKRPPTRRRNERFSVKSLAALQYAYSRHDPHECQRSRNKIAAIFEGATNEFCESVSVSGDLFDKIYTYQRKDAVFLNSLAGSFNSVLSVPRKFEENRDRRGTIMLSPAEKDKVDKVLRK
ncbi:hypothetical protein [Paracoccus sediminicola]|uniref:hypothetical protein n=1 Tax=Paracoccus sediminicola TaxID=3017783 RepID=UPI0022F088B9|nr:hypothetical protein [Paracoccus sediminicola]WBU57793.1 hypothetical protein PAF18_05025 [Paracoccus sediminicola]